PWYVALCWFAMSGDEITSAFWQLSGPWCFGQFPPRARSSHSQERESATSPLFAGHYPSSKVVTPNTRSSRNGGIASVIHTRSLEHWHEPQVLRQRDRVAVDAGNIEEDVPAADAGPQSRPDDLGGSSS